MKLPKHRMAKKQNVKATKRSAKHKVYKHTTNESSDSVSNMDVENEGDEEQSTADAAAQEENASANKSTPKTKEEKKAIRQARRKKNFSANFYKVRAGNVTGKNGPRAINQVSLK